MTQRTDFLTDDEVAALNEPAPKVEEPGPTPEPTVDTEEPSPPEPEKPEEPAPEGEPEPEKKEEPKPEEPPVVDGIMTKDGKHFMPFGVLEQERAKRQESEARAKDLEAKLAEATKPKEPAREPEVPRAPEIDLDTQLEAIAKQVAQKGYESEEGMAEGLKEGFKQVFNLVQQTLVPVVQHGAQAAVTANSFEAEAAKIKAANPWLNNQIGPGLTVEDLVTATAHSMAKANPNLNVNDINVLVKLTQDAVNQVKGFLKVDEKPFDREAELKKIREEERQKATKEVMQKFNITEPTPKTLSNVRNLSPELITKLDLVEQLEGTDFEEAYAKLSPAEKKEIDKRGSL